MATMNRPATLGATVENRKSLEFGRITAYDDTNKMLDITLSDGSVKTISYGTYKGAWRKKAEEVLAEPEETSTEEVVSVTDFVKAVVETVVNEEKKITKRKPLKNLKMNTLEYDGRVQKITAWAKEVNLPYATLYYRVNRNGWTAEQAINTPFGGKKRDLLK